MGRKKAMKKNSNIPKSVKVDRRILNDAVKRLAKLAKSSSMPILNHLLLKSNGNSLKLVSTDIETRLTLEIPCKGPGLEEVLVPVKIFQKLIKGKVSDDLLIVLHAKSKITKEETNSREWNESTGAYKETIDVYNGELAVQVEGITTKIKLTTNPDEFPEPMADDKGEWKYIGTVNGKQWKMPLDYVRLASSNDESRYNITGIFINSKCMVATDGHRLHKVDGKFGFKGEQKALLGGMTVRMLADFISEKKNHHFRIDMSEKIIVLASTEEDESKWKIEARLLDGEFPAYEYVIPTINKTSGGFDVDKEKFLKVLKRMKSLSNSRFECNFTLSDSSFEFRVVNDGNETQTDLEVENIRKIKLVNTDNDGSKTFGMNLKYIEDTLKFPGEKISFFMNDDLSPGVFKTEEDEDYLAVVMPLRF